MASSVGPLLAKRALSLLKGLWLLTGLSSIGPCAVCDSGKYVEVPH